MSDPFVHLRVASGYSLRHGASHPSALVELAAEHGMDTLALTDRDGLYGSIRFAKACLRAGVAPVVGVDLAVPFHHRHLAPQAPSRNPARGGVSRDARHPRVVVLATSRDGWGALCRLTSATHLAGARGEAIASAEEIGRHALERGGLVVMLGADSELGAAVGRGDRPTAEAELARWCGLVGRENVVVAATDHEVAGTGPGSLRHAGRMLALADDAAVTCVLTNDVRMAHRHDAPTVDVLDASRRLVPLDLRHLDRRNAEGHLKSGKEMLHLAQAVARAGGRGEHGAERLLADTRAVGLRCALDPRADLGLGEIHLPEFGASVDEAMHLLTERCRAGLSRRYGGSPRPEVVARLEEELGTIAHLGFPAYFLTVADVTDMIRDLGVRCAARGSGAGSLVNYLLGISGVDPLEHGLLMERFLSPLRQALPDIDVDVESARRTEIYRAILDRFGGERVACVAMLETYRVRHAVRDVGAALSMPPHEVDAIAKAFPHIRARDARAALRDLPELRAAGLAERRLDLFFSLVESLDGLPRHVAVHPCGVLLSDATLLDRTPVEASAEGFPMSQFDKDDVEDIGLLKLDVLGIRMQSAMAHALGEIERTEGVAPDIDALAPFDDPDVYGMIGATATLGCFQIESPGQRELVGKFGPRTFDDVIIDISLFRPGPMKTDMIVPFLNARNGWDRARYLHPDLVPVLEETCGVMVFHEQVIRMVSVMTGCSLAQGDEARRALGDRIGQEEVRRWWFPRLRERGYAEDVIERTWDILAGFASFGFCKAHAAAFALPTYQSAWLKQHHPAHFLAGVLTHDPGMYPKRLLLEEARRCGVEVLGLDVNASGTQYTVERVEGATAEVRPDWPDGRGWGIRLPFTDVAGISVDGVARLVAGQPYTGLTDLWERAAVGSAAVENLILAGGFDALYGIGRATAVARHGRVTRRDLLLTLADLRRSAQADARARSRARGLRALPVRTDVGTDPRDLARAQVSARAEGVGGTGPRHDVQLALDFADREAVAVAADVVATGLPEMADDERLRAELSVLGLDVSEHVVSFHLPLLRALGVTPAVDLMKQRSESEVLVAGVKVATQTPPVRSGRRVVFLTLDDGSGLSDSTFFEDVQGGYARTVFESWLLVVRGTVRRTGPRGISLTASGAWDLDGLAATWRAVREETGSEEAALAAVRAVLATEQVGFGGVGAPVEPGLPGAAHVLPDGERGPGHGSSGAPDTEHVTRAGGMGQRRVLVHVSGARQSPYADIAPAGTPASQVPRKLWHSSPGSSGR